MNEFIERYKQMCPDFKLESNVVKSIRINTLKVKDIKRLSRFKLEKLPLDFSYVSKTKLPMGATLEYLEGYYYLQELGSQAAVQVLDPKENDVVLDMAASPGGKTTQISQYMNNKGVVFALELKKQRLPSLINNINRMGAKNVIVYNMDAKDASELDTQFDKILLDAPCSGNYTKESDWFEKRTLTDIKKNSTFQRNLLKSALSLLKEGGILVYSTCSLEPEENELNIDWLLSEEKVTLEEIKLPIGSKGLTNFDNKDLNPELSKTVRFWPHKEKTQGFFIAKIRK